MTDKGKMKKGKRTSRRGRTYRQIAGAEVASINKKRIGYGFLLVVLMFTILLFRLAYWQVVKADDLRERAISMQRIDTQLEPSRGTIYDAKMKPLAQTVTKYDLYGYTQYLYKSSDLTHNSKEKTVNGLAKITEKKPAEIKKLLSADENLILIAEGLTQEQVEKAQKLCGNNVSVKTSTARSYPNGSFASHVIGTVNEQNSGRIGLEYEYNSTLAGVKGRVVRTTDSQGNALSLGSTKFYEAIDGSSIVTTIDTVIQSYVEEVISKGMVDFGAESIAAIAMDPNTGDILAMAKTPSFDPNKPEQPADPGELKAFKKMKLRDQNDYLSKMWTNTSVSSLYEPGSTFKLLCSSAALDCGSATVNSKYYCNGSINVDGVTMHCAEGEVHGSQSLTDAVAHSCNVAHVNIAMNMGRDNYFNYLNLYGIMGKTNVDLPAEAEPLVKNRDTMTNIDFANMGFGQGIAVTPIQMITAVSAVVNGGKLMQPKLVKSVLNSEGKVIQKKPDRVVRQAISKEVSDEMREIMRNSVINGSGERADVPGYRVGGKTGTANIPTESGGYSDDGALISSFVGAAPMDDPKIAVIVIVTRPSKGASFFGSYNATPMAGEIIEKSLTYMNVDRKYTDEEKETKNAKRLTVPDVTGIDSKTAVGIIKSYGFVAKIEPESTKGNFQVVDQYPKANQKAAKGATVYIYSE